MGTNYNATLKITKVYSNRKSSNWLLTVLIHKTCPKQILLGREGQRRKEYLNLDAFKHDGTLHICIIDVWQWPKHDSKKIQESNWFSEKNKPIKILNIGTVCNVFPKSFMRQ